MLYVAPPPGISAWARESDSRIIDAVLDGADGTPYAGGRFRLQLSMPERYPFEPPKVQYITPIYHPNIDSVGRICLDILNLPPKGAWKPSLNIATVLQSLRLLMAEPNPDDGLMVDITHQYIHDRARFERTAVEYTSKHAQGKEVEGGGGGDAETVNGAADASSTTAGGASSSDSAAAGAPAVADSPAAGPAVADAPADSQPASAAAAASEVALDNSESAAAAKRPKLN